MFFIFSWFSGSAKSERQLFEEAKRGKSESLDALFRMHRETLTRKLSRDFPGLSWDLAEDAVQTAFMQFCEKIESIEIKSTVSGYLYMAARNRCVDLLRGGARHKESSLYDSEDEKMIDIADPDSDISDMDIDLPTAMSKLSDHDALILKLFLLHEMSKTEISLIVGKSIAQTTRDVEKAIGRLRILLSEYAPCKKDDAGNAITGRRE